MTSAQLLARRALKLATDLLAIAADAMPDTYFASDSRVQHARETIQLLTRKKGGRTRERKPTAGLRTWEVWSEGYAATGERCGAVCHGKAKAETFREACDKVLGWNAPTYDAATATYWGCRLYNNERDARRSFG